MGETKQHPNIRERSARTDARRTVAARMRAEGRSLTAIGKELGVTPQAIRSLLKPIPPNLCRKCGSEVERQKQYHPECLPSRRIPMPRTPKPPTGLTGRTFGDWTVIGPGKTAGRWQCRCVCGAVGFVYRTALERGRSRACWRCVFQAKKPRGASYIEHPDTEDRDALPSH